MKRFDPWWIIVVLSLFAASALAEENESIGFVGVQYHYDTKTPDKLIGVTIFTCEACASVDLDTSHLVFEYPAVVRVNYSAVSHDFVILPLNPDVWVRRKTVNVEDTLFRLNQQPRKKSEVIFLGSVGSARSSGYEFPVVGVLTNVNLRIGRFAIIAGGGWDPRAQKMGVGDGWIRNLGAGLQVYFREYYFIQFDVSRTEQFTSEWQKQFTWVGGDFGYRTPKFETKFGICQDIESYNEVLAITYSTKWYFPLSQSDSWGFTAGFAGSISRFNQRRDGEWLRLTSGNVEVLSGLFFRF